MKTKAVIHRNYNISYKLKRRFIVLFFVVLFCTQTLYSGILSIVGQKSMESMFLWSIPEHAEMGILNPENLNLVCKSEETLFVINKR